MNESAAALQTVIQPLLQFADITDPLLITAALFFRSYSHWDSDLG